MTARQAFEPRHLWATWCCVPRTLAGLGLIVVAGCTTFEPPQDRSVAHFDRWRAALPAAAATELQSFEAFLAAHGLQATVPLHELLRSASDWHACAAEPFSLPPRDNWPAVRSVVQLVQALRREAILDRFEVVSAHRGAALNACAGGARRSAHLVSFAMDLIAEDAKGTGERLCRFWQTQGAAWRMGLSQYPSGRIHIDTQGYRTWGADHSTGTAFCAPLPPMG